MNISATIVIILIVLGLAVVMARFLLKRRQIRKLTDEIGLNREEAVSLLQNLRKGNQDAALEQISIAQEQQRAVFKHETGIDLSTFVAEIGQEISWADVVKQIFRVLEFDKAGSTISPDGDVKATSFFTPYGYLLVESPILNNRARLPIIHRDDFLLAASVFDEPELADLVLTGELLVTYAPRKMRPGGLSGDPSHVLHYVMTPEGTLDKYYSKDNDIHMAKPNPGLLFGEFVYEGEIRVQMNSKPSL